MFTDLLLCNIFWYRISLVYQGRLPGADITHWQNLLDILNIDTSYQEACKVIVLFITSDICNTNVSNHDYNISIVHFGETRCLQVCLGCVSNADPIKDKGIPRNFQAA